MDWKYKHFHQERVFPAPRDLVTEAARTFMTESLGWQITNTPEGLTAEGYSFSHQAMAHLHFESAADGTRVAIELLVERAGWRGFMLFDAGGYYNIQDRKWLDGIQWSIHQKLTGTRDESTNPLVLAQNKPAAYIDRKSTRLNSSHDQISYAVFCLKKKKQMTDGWQRSFSMTAT